MPPSPPPVFVCVIRCCVSNKCSLSLHHTPQYEDKSIILDHFSAFNSPINLHHESNNSSPTPSSGPSFHHDHSHIPPVSMVSHTSFRVEICTFLPILTFYTAKICRYLTPLFFSNLHLLVKNQLPSRCSNHLINHPDNHALAHWPQEPQEESKRRP